MSKDEFQKIYDMIPVHPGDDIYYIDELAAWMICKTKVYAMSITEDGIGISIFEDEPDANSFLLLGEECHETEELARKWVKENCPDPPLPYATESFNWMNTAKWIPWSSEWVYARIPIEKQYITCLAYYRENEGFYNRDGDDAEKIENVAAWMTVYGSIKDAAHKEDFDFEAYQTKMIEEGI